MNNEKEKDSDLIFSAQSLNSKYEPVVINNKFLSSTPSALVELENESQLFNGKDQTDAISREVSIDISVENDKKRLYSFLKKRN